MIDNTLKQLVNNKVITRFTGQALRIALKEERLAIKKLTLNDIKNINNELLKDDAIVSLLNPRVEDVILRYIGDKDE